MVFKKFKEAVQKQFSQMAKHTLFFVKVDKDEFWEKYLDSFPPEVNKKFRERREYDCQTCRRFIRPAGHIVAVIKGKRVSIWDIDIGGEYQKVADALSKYVKSLPIENVFVHPEKQLGVDFNIQAVKDENDEVVDTLKWHHFFFELPDKFVMPETKRTRVSTGASSDDAEVEGTIGHFLSKKRSNFDGLKRSLETISMDAVKIVLELITPEEEEEDVTPLYRGEERKKIVLALKEMKKAYAKFTTIEQKDNYCWLQSIKLGGVSKIRNTSIGTLLVAITKGEKSLIAAVKSYEDKVAGCNYQRPNPVITPGATKNALKRVKEWKIEKSLERRPAELSDVSVNNVLWVNRAAKRAMKPSKTEQAFEDLLNSTSVINSKRFGRATEMKITDFMKAVLPNTKDFQVFVANDLVGNFMSLVTAVHSDAPLIFKWNNPFSWTYRGEMADAMRELVRGFGGKVDDVVSRFSIKWDGNEDNNDYDAHCKEPSGRVIYFDSKGKVHPSSGILDVDIINPLGDNRCINGIAVENIVHTDLGKMPRGVYEWAVNNYEHRGGTSGFEAELELNGKVHSYRYPHDIPDKETVVVARAELKADGKFEMLYTLPNSEMSKKIWGVHTQNFRKVNTVMLSPNHWDGQSVGNKHWFFILDKCLNEQKARGFYNEFLQERFREDRRVFEVLGSRMRAEMSDNQLSGLGFSSTKKFDVLCKADGRVIKVTS